MYGYDILFIRVELRTQAQSAVPDFSGLKKVSQSLDILRKREYYRDYPDGESFEFKLPGKRAGSEKKFSLRDTKN